MTDISMRFIGHIPTNMINADGLVQQVLEITNRHMQRTVQQGKKYPSPPPNSKYKRTGGIRDGWRMSPAKLSGDTIRGTVTNVARTKAGNHYASFVFGSSEYEQAEVHQGRWPTREELFDREGYLADIRAAVAASVGL